MCRPVGGSREEGAGGHIGPPLHGVGSVWEPTGIGAERCLSRRGGTEPAPYGGSGGVRGGVWSPRPTGATQVVRSSGPMYLRHGFRRPNFVPKFGAPVMGIGPYGETGKSQQTPGPAAHSGASAARSQGMGGNCGRDHPKRAINLGQSLSRPPGASSLYTREPLGTGDADRRVGPAGLLAMTMVFCHSEASVHTGRGNPSFLRWTGVRAAPRKTRGTARRVVVPYGKPNQPPKPAGAQRSVRASGGEGWAGIGAKAIPKGGPPRDLPGSA